MRLRVLAWLLATLLITVAIPASALVLQRLSLNDLVARSTAVIRGVVLGSEARWNSAHDRIHTAWKVEVTEPVVGAERGQVLTVITLGGRVDDVVQTVPGNVKLSDGEEVLLLLVPNGDAYSIAGTVLGKYTVVHDPNGGPDRVTREAPTGNGALPDAPTLDELVQQIHDLRKEATR